MSGTPPSLAVSSSQRAGAVVAAARSSGRVGAPLATRAVSIAGQGRTAPEGSTAQPPQGAQIARTCQRSAPACGISVSMNFEQALKQGDLDVARALLAELVELPDTGGLLMPECYADLAREYDRQGRHDDAIALHERAIEFGWDSIPDPDQTSPSFTFAPGARKKRPRSGPS